MDLSKMVFVTGFARGGTTWLRNSIGTHPQIGIVRKELVLFRDHAGDRSTIERALDEAAESLELDPALPFYVEKSPANAPFVDQACRTLPEAKFIFIIRDPRDVFISHKRGTEAWMGGKNSTVKGCLEKTRHYFEGFERARDADNVMLVRYEDLHQDFKSTIREVFDFIGAETTDEILARCHEQNDFWKVATRHIERRDKPARKGVVGDWVNFLDKDEAKWIRKNRFWSRFMEDWKYSWEPLTYGRILEAMVEGGVNSVSEDDLHDQRLDPERPNTLLTHDIDNLTAQFCEPSILALAEREAKLGLAALYFFLPMDDPRYKGVRPAAIAKLINRLRNINPRLTVGLHLNAAEKFFPPDLEPDGDDHPDLPRAIEYLHEQIDAYANFDIEFRTASAHGYGRRKKRPNNRDTPVFTEELAKRGVKLWDTVLRPKIFGAATHVVHFADVGGAIAARDMPHRGAIDDPETYRGFPAGSLVHFLMHPGNYDTRNPITHGRRTIAATAHTLAAR